MFFRKKKKDTVEFILHNENEQLEPRPCPFCGMQPKVRNYISGVHADVLWSEISCPICHAKIARCARFQIDENGNIRLSDFEEHPRTKAVKYWNGIQ